MFLPEENIFYCFKTMRINTVLLTFIVANFTMITGSRYCSWSKATAVSVTSCPRAKPDVEKRSKLKNCPSLAVIQNCSEPMMFKYHCVMNENENSFFEVCAPEYYILGACAEYNTYGAVIQPHYRLKCSNVDPPCANRYISTDAYLYEGCYNVVEKNMHKLFTELQLNTPVIIQNNESTISGRGEASDRRYHILIGCVAVAATIVGILIIRRTCASDVENNSYEKKKMPERREKKRKEGDFTPV